MLAETGVRYKQELEFLMESKRAQTKTRAQEDCFAWGQLGVVLSDWMNIVIEMKQQLSKHGSPGSKEMKNMKEKNGMGWTKIKNTEWKQMINKW